MNEAILLISSKDQRGITAAITNFVFSHNGNIIHADQHIDEQTNTFFMRIQWSLDGFDLDKADIAQAFEPIAQSFAMNWQLYLTDHKVNVALFVSKHLHCLYDLLYRYRSGELNCHIPLIISNHADGEVVAKDFGIPFHPIAVSADNKNEAEQQQIKLLKESDIELIVLARYHQILSAEFVNEYENQIINIHHSFLPAFAGKNPYARAYNKGVKIIGATSHYVTAELDEGPIIEQDTVRVSHSDSIEHLKRKGSDLEKMVLNRAVRWHLERKILAYDNKTVIFD